MAQCKLGLNSRIRINLTGVTLESIGSYSLWWDGGSVNQYRLEMLDSNNIALNGFKELDNGSYQLKFFVKAQAYGAGGNVIAENSQGYQIWTFQPAVSVLGGDTLFETEKYRNYLILDKQVTTSGYGYLSLYFQTSTTIAASDKLLLTPPTLFGSQFNYYTRCKFKDLSADKREGEYL